MSTEAESTATKFPSSPPPSGTNPLTGALPPVERSRQPTIHPSDLEQLSESYSKRTKEDLSPEQAISGKIDDLEKWAAAIARRERMETARFWILKGISFFGAVVTAAGGALLLSKISLAAGVVTAIAISVDAAWPNSGDRNARRRAIHDLRQLQHTLKLKWEKVRLAHPDPLAIKRIAHALALLDAAQSKREEIGGYLGEESPAVEKSVV